jgi:hypothetical protein
MTGVAVVLGFVLGWAKAPEINSTPKARQKKHLFMKTAFISSGAKNGNEKMNELSLKTGIFRNAGYAMKEIFLQHTGQHLTIISCR